jgi:hypothetical protein
MLVLTQLVCGRPYGALIIPVIPSRICCLYSCQRKRTFKILKKEAILSSETLVPIYQGERPDVPKDCDLHCFDQHIYMICRIEDGYNVFARNVDTHVAEYTIS